MLNFINMVIITIITNDNLYFRTRILDLLLPTMGTQIIAQNVVDVLQVLKHQYDNIVVHTFSVGGYQFGEVLVRLKRQQNNRMKEYLMKNWKGLVLDSPVDVEFAALGTSKAITNNKMFRIVIIYLMKTYMIIFYLLSTRHYWISSNSVKEHPNKCPILFLFSKSDKMSDVDNNNTWINKFRQRGIPVMYKCWDRSSHVAHFAKYPDEYQHILNEFLKKCT